MAVLTPTPSPASGWPRVTPFPGADAVLAAQSAALPQPDQLCGPFAAHAALQAVLDPGPTMLDLAIAAGTAIWPHDVADWRPAGAPLVRTGWDLLPTALSAETSGTDAAGLALGVSSVTDGEVVAVPVSGLGAARSDLDVLLHDIGSAAYPIGVVANVLTGALDALSEGPAAWDVGHFVVLWGRAADGRIAVADSYHEMGEPGAPPGCRLVTVEALTSAIRQPPGRGLLLLARDQDAPDVHALVRALGLDPLIWAT